MHSISSDDLNEKNKSEAQENRLSTSTEDCCASKCSTIDGIKVDDASSRERQNISAMPDSVRGTGNSTNDLSTPTIDRTSSIKRHDLSNILLPAEDIFEKVHNAKTTTQTRVIKTQPKKTPEIFYNATGTVERSTAAEVNVANQFRWFLSYRYFFGSR